MQSPATEEKLVLTILELAAALNRRGDVISEQVGITTQQWIIMLYIYGDPNIPYIGKKYSADKHFQHNAGMLASDIAEALNVSRPNITNIINLLTAKELVEQQPDENDRRRKILRLTPKGIEVLKRIEPFRRKANLALFSALSKEQLEATLHNLEIILQILKRVGA
ncbi:MAG: MarR family transcriptional regulator [Cytophagales bacterium]|nr:MarR family transcriptional regulator [Bernardetiaceae bacterium]MDW8211844.1 MarR family transcriptional regulator [Cytophagales bacterium]